MKRLMHKSFDICFCWPQPFLSAILLSAFALFGFLFWILWFVCALVFAFWCQGTDGGGGLCLRPRFLILSSSVSLV